jgi:hypothetical protein
VGERGIEENETEGEVWMRLLTINLLAMALLLFSVATASAYRVDITSPQDTGGFNPAPVSSFVTVNVYLDTEGVGNIKTISVGVEFDNTKAVYEQALSSTPTYLLYTTSKAPYLTPLAGICDGGLGCIEWPAPPPTQVLIAWASTDLFSGVPGISAGSELIATLVFHVIDDAGPGAFNLLFDTTAGADLLLGDNTRPPMNLGGGITINVPEPTTALLIGLGLVGLGFAGRRSR